MTQEFWNEFNEKVGKVKEALDALCEIVPPKEKEKQKTRWKAEYKETYWCLYSNGDIVVETEIGCQYDIGRYKLGNYFKTHEEAEAYRDNLITKQELKDLAFKLNGYKDVDWENECVVKYYISLRRNELDLDTTYIWQGLGQIYCTSLYFLDDAIKQIGEERLIKLIKSGV